MHCAGVDSCIFYTSLHSDKKNYKVHSRYATLDDSNAVGTNLNMYFVFVEPV